MRRRTTVVSTEPPASDDSAPPPPATSKIVPARRIEYPLTCCARASIACLLLISIVALVASMFAAYYAHETFVHVSMQTNISAVDVAAHHHKRAVAAATKQYVRQVTQIP